MGKEGHRWKGVGSRGFDRQVFAVLPLFVVVLSMPGTHAQPPCCSVANTTSGGLVGYPWEGPCSCLAVTPALGLQGMNITALPDSWGHPSAFPLLQALNLTGNQIAALPDTWGQRGAFPQLGYLDLSRNQIASLPEGWGEAGAFEALEGLVLDENRIPTFPASWTLPTAFVSLQFLALGSNVLKLLPEAQPGSLKSLENLDLTHNQLEILPDSWGFSGAFSSLSVLSLSFNRIRALPDAWGGASSFGPGLIAIAASENLIPQVPLSWSSPEGQISRSVRYLSIGGNPLRSPPRLSAACFDDVGCVFNIYGTPQVHRLSSSYRKQLCLHKASVLLDNNTAAVQIEVTNRTAFSLTTAGDRSFSLLDPNVLQEVLPYFSSTSYTGVDFVPPPGDKCRDEKAPLIISITWATFLVLTCLVLIAMRVLQSCFRRLSSRGGLSSEVDPGAPGGFLLYVVGMPWAAIHLATVVTDFILLVAVWGVWPMWFIMGFLLPPYIASAWMLGPDILRSNLVSLGAWCKAHRLGLTFNWHLTQGTSPTDWDGPSPKRTLSVKEKLLVPVLLPVTVMATIGLDLLTIISRLGLHFKHGVEVLNLSDYYTSRILLQCMLGTSTQAVFQSVLFAQGTSRHSRIYVDRLTFLASIGTSLLALLLQICTSYYEKMVNELSVVGFLQWKLRNSSVKLWHAPAHSLQRRLGGAGAISGGDSQKPIWDRLPSQKSEPEVAISLGVADAMRSMPLSVQD